VVEVAPTGVWIELSSVVVVDVWPRFSSTVVQAERNAKAARLRQGIMMFFIN